MNIYLKVTITTILYLFSPYNIFGQEYNYPIYEGRSIQEIEILKITINDKYTIVECVHKNIYSLGWATVMPNTFIRISGKTKKYKLLKTHKIPVFPNKHYYKKIGEKLRYKLYFQTINPAVKYLDVIELEGSDKAFNFYKIQLKPIA